MGVIMYFYSCPVPPPCLGHVSLFLLSFIHSRACSLKASSTCALVFFKTWFDVVIHTQTHVKAGAFWKTLQTEVFQKISPYSNQVYRNLYSCWGFIVLSLLRDVVFCVRCLIPTLSPSYRTKTVLFWIFLAGLFTCVWINVHLRSRCTEGEKCQVAFALRFFNVIFQSII